MPVHGEAHGDIGGSGGGALEHGLFGSHQHRPFESRVYQRSGPRERDRLGECAAPTSGAARSRSPRSERSGDAPQGATQSPVRRCGRNDSGRRGAPNSEAARTHEGPRSSSDCHTLPHGSQASSRCRPRGEAPERRSGVRRRAADGWWRAGRFWRQVPEGMAQALAAGRRRPPASRRARSRLRCSAGRPERAALTPVRQECARGSRRMHKSFGRTRTHEVATRL